MRFSVELDAVAFLHDFRIVSTTSLPPAAQPGETPPLYKLPPRNFERICRDLLREEQGIATSTLWGVEGQAQQGIDVLADADDAIHLELGQCKCYREFGPSEIRKACAEFIRHWDHWESRNVRRFILFVACSVENTKSRRAILEQKKWFSQHGIRFELWDAPHLFAKLNPHPGIVRQYFVNPEYWVSVICQTPQGPAGLTLSPPEHNYASQLLLQQVNELAAALSSTAAEQVEGAREAWQEGRRDDAVTQLRQIRQHSSRWSVLSPAVKAKVLRLEANFELATSGDSLSATRLAEEADALDPENAGRLRVLLAYADGGPAAGLTALERYRVDDPEFHAALLLEDGQVEASLARIIEAEKEKPLTAELHRIRVLALLASRDVARATTAAAQGLRQKPRWEAVRLTAAMVDYYSALSPAALPGRVPAWPTPVDWTRIKRDDASVTRLRQAEAVFREVSLQPDPVRTNVTNLEGWTLACLGCDAERQDEAAELCRSILAANPSHVPALAWAIARRFEVPLEPSLAALRERVGDPDAELEEIIAFVNAAMFAGHPERAAEALDRAQLMFGEQGEEVAWTAWRLHAALQAGETERAESILGSIEEDPRFDELRPLKARIQAERADDASGLLELLTAEYLASGNPAILLESCMAAARADRWEYVSNRAHELIELIGTAEAVRLAAFGHFNVRNYDQALSYLDEHLGLFRQRRLPPDLKRLRVRVQEALGVLPQAVIEAEELVREEPSTVNLLELARVYASKGDLRAVGGVGRRLKSRSDLSPANALRLVAIIQVEDPVLSRDLWRAAVKSKLPNNLVEQAVELGFRLGVDTEMGPLMRRFYALAESGGRFRVLRSVEEALPLLEGARQSAERRDALYRSGDVPIHVLLAVSRVPLVELYHSTLERNEQDPKPLQQTAVRTRHGGRPSPSLSGQGVRWRLHADVTAILLSQHLEVLVAIEEAFGPIRITPELIPSMVVMRTQLAHPQTSQVDAARVLTQATAKSLLHTTPNWNSATFEDETWHAVADAKWTTLWHRAAAEGAVVCDDLPLYHEGDLDRPADLPDRVRALVAEPAAIAESLRDLGAITEAQFESAVAFLPPPNAMRGTAKPAAGQQIYCARHAASTLAQMGVLEAACGVFQISVPADDVHEAAARLSAHAEREEVDRWLAELVKHISDGIETGSYEVIPAPRRAAEEDGEEDDGTEKDLILRGLRTLLDFEGRGGDVVWLDDRYMTGYQHRDGYPIVDTVEVLAALVAGGAVSAVQYHQLVARLRAANVRLLPLSPEELSHHLRRARIESGRVVETPEMKVLRRYVAATFLDGQTLQRAFAPDGTPTERHELSYIVSLSNAVYDALTALWEDEAASMVERRARSEWLIESLFLDLGSARGVVGLHAPDEDDRFQLALSLAGFVVRGLVMEGWYKAELDAGVREYLDWVTTSLLQPRLEADPRLLAALAHMIAEQILDAGRDIPPDLRTLRVQALQRLFDRLPPFLQEELVKNPDFTREVRLKIERTSEVAGFKFPARAFVRGVARTANGLISRISLLGQKGTVRLLPSRDPVNWRQMQLARGRKRWDLIYEGPVFGILRDSMEERTESLNALRRYFIGSEAEFEEAVARVATLTDPYDRMQEVEAWRAKSPAYHYESLTSRIAEHDRISVSELRPPDLVVFVRAHGLTGTIDSAEKLRHALGEAASRWLKTEGLEAAFLRICGIPIPLPEVLMEAFAAITPEERRDIVRGLLRATRSPVARVQLLRLMAQAPAEFRLLMRWIIRCLFAASGELAFRAFVAMLEHTDSEFTDPAAEGWPPVVRLAMVWSHSYNLFEAMQRADAKLEAAPEWFAGAPSRGLTPLFVRDPDYQRDVAHPKQLGYASFLLTGLGYALDRIPAVARDLVPQAVMLEMIAPGKESRWQLDIGVVRDPFLATNALESFLGDDRGTALRIICSEASPADELALAAPKSFVEAALDQVGRGSHAEGWAGVYAVVGDNPMYLELREKLEQSLLGTDLIQLYASDPPQARMLLQIAAVQATHERNTVLSTYVGEALVGIAGTCGCDAADEKTAMMQIEIMLRLAWQHTEPRLAAAEFARLAGRVLDACPDFATYWRIPAQRLWAEVPAPCARPLAQLLVRVRAE